MTLLIAALIPNLALSETIKNFYSATEDSTEKWSSVSNNLAHKIIALENMTKQVDEEVKEKALPKDYRQFFASKQINLSHKTHNYIFVRPKSTPYFNSFYGAHTFMHWITQGDEVIYSGNSDYFKVLSTIKRGMHDIEEVQCRVNKCYLTRLSYNGRSYSPSSCQTHDLETGKFTQGCK